MCDELEFPLTRCPAIFMGTARPVGRTGGRPPKLTDDDIEAVKALLVNPDIGVTQIARRLGFSPVTLYQYIPTARTESPWTFEKRRLYQSSSWPRLNGSSRPFSITQPSRWERLFLESKQTHRRSMENGAA